MDILELMTREKSKDGRNYHLAIPFNMVKTVRCICGGEATWCTVNEIEVEDSYESVIRRLKGE